MFQSCWSIFVCVLAVSLFGITAGKNTILYDKLIKCVQLPSSNLRETYLQSSWCGTITFRLCYEDDVTGYGTVSVLHEECGFISSYQTDFYTHTWRIRVKQSVWINMLLFSLYFDHFPCSAEYMAIRDGDVKNVYCGYRFPWKYYSTDSAVSIKFIKSPLYYRGRFKMFFQEGKKVLHKTQIFSAQLYEQNYLFNEKTHEERQLLYLVANRSRAIEVNIISLCWSGIHAALYDGPGVKSPQKRVSAKVTSSAFIMLLVIIVGDSNTPITGCQSYLDLQYKSIYNDMEKCQESVQENVMQISIRNEPLGTGRCVWSIPAYANMLKITDESSLNRPETLLDEEHCIYGGIYIYAMRNSTEMEEVLSRCRRQTDLTPFKFIPDDDDDATIVIVAVKFSPYSEIDQPFILMYEYKNVWNKKLYNRRINECNSKNICEIILGFPDDPCIRNPHHSNLYNTDLNVQYIGEPDVSIRVEFSENVAPKYNAIITSSLCQTPPYYCACVKIHVQYANSVSYFVADARHTEHIVSMTKGDTTVDVSLASSLYINTSACEEIKPKVWWHIRFEKWKFPRRYADIDIKKINLTFPFLPNEKCILYTLTFDNILTARTPSPWWYIVHIMPKILQNHQEKEMDYATKVCMECLTCHNIEVYVEVLEPGRKESIVYSVSNNELIERHHNCITGILCKTCNIILIYKGNLAPDQSRGCMCYRRKSTFSVQVEQVARMKKQSTFVTSIKQTQTSKISSR